MTRYSLMVEHPSITSQFSIATEWDMGIEQNDIETTFLYGDLDEVIYMAQP